MQLLISGSEVDPDTTLQNLGVLMVLDTESNEILHSTTYYPDETVEGEKIEMTGYCWIGDVLYVCSHKEISVYEDWPPTNPSRMISIPGFNDLHDCYDWHGHLAVANTGLETVDIVSIDGQLLERYDMLRDEPKARTIDENCDYRLIPDTKPHLRHPNHIFELDGKLWTSQLRTSDAVQVDDLSNRLEMGAGMPHDGTVFDNQLVFTITSGQLVFFDLNKEMTRRIVDMNPLVPELDQLGWCRGVTRVPDNPDLWIVGFSSLRRSKWKEFGYWIKHGHTQPISRVAIFDLNEGRQLSTHSFGEDTGFQIYQIEVLPPAMHL